MPLFTDWRAAFAPPQPSQNQMIFFSHDTRENHRRKHQCTRSPYPSARRQIPRYVRRALESLARYSAGLHLQRDCRNHKNPSIAGTVSRWQNLRVVGKDSATRFRGQSTNHPLKHEAPQVFQALGTAFQSNLLLMIGAASQSSGSFFKRIKNPRNTPHSIVSRP